MGRLSGKTALITGTASGQGAVAARLFAAEGARVLGCDLDAAGDRETVARVVAAGGTMTSLAPVDLADPADVSRLMRRVRDAGGLDVLYNNAGRPRMAAFEAMSFEDWRFTLANELDLVFLACREAWPLLVERGEGAVINTASTLGLRGIENLGSAAHAAAKAGVIGLTRQLAVEGAPHGIRVNALSPGTIETPATADVFSSPGGREAIARMSPLGLTGRSEDVAYAALFLASDEARFVTGINLPVDGGALAFLRNTVGAPPPHASPSRS